MKTLILVLISFLIGWRLGVVLTVPKVVDTTVKTLKEKNLLKNYWQNKQKMI